MGIVHTNYLEYIKREKNGALQAFFVKHINNWVTRAYCHKVYEDLRFLCFNFGFQILYLRVLALIIRCMVLNQFSYLICLFFNSLVVQYLAISKCFTIFI